MSKRLLILESKTMKNYGLGFLEPYLYYHPCDAFAIFHDTELNTYNGVLINDEVIEQSKNFVERYYNLLRSHQGYYHQYGNLSISANSELAPLFVFRSADHNALPLCSSDFFVKLEEGVDEIVVDCFEDCINDLYVENVEADIKFISAFLDFKPEVLSSRDFIADPNEFDFSKLKLRTRSHCRDVAKCHLKALINLIDNCDRFTNIVNKYFWLEEVFFTTYYKEITEETFDKLVKLLGMTDYELLDKIGHISATKCQPEIGITEEYAANSTKNVKMFTRRFLNSHPKINSLKSLKKLMEHFGGRYLREKGCGVIVDIPDNLNADIVKIINRNQKASALSSYLDILIYTFGDNFSWVKIDKEIMERMFPNGVTIGSYTFMPEDGTDMSKYENAQPTTIDELLKYVYTVSDYHTRKLFFALLALYTDDEFNSNMLTIANAFLYYIQNSNDMKSLVSLKSLKSFVNDDVKVYRELRPETAERYDERVKIIMNKLCKDIRKLNSKSLYVRLSIFVEIYSLQDYFDETIIGTDYKKAVFEKKLK